MLLTILTAALGAAAIAVGAWIPTRIKKPTDLERANLLALMAQSAAALAVSMFPKAPAAELVRFVVQQLTGAAGIPTTNADAIQRAAVKALTDLGKMSDAGTER